MHPLHVYFNTVVKCMDCTFLKSYQLEHEIPKTEI
jgi:hypothetical protein